MAPIKSHRSLEIIKLSCSAERNMCLWNNDHGGVIWLFLEMKSGDNEPRNVGNLQKLEKFKKVEKKKGDSP